MVRFIICSIITLCAFLCGNEFYKSKKHSLAVCRELKEILSDIIVSVNYLSLDVFDICKQAFEKRTACNYQSFKDISDGDFPSKWQSACKSALCLLSDDEIQLFSQIGTILGSCDRDSQVKKLEYIESTLDKSYKRKAFELESKQKLYYTVSISCGLLLCLVIA